MGNYTFRIHIPEEDDPFSATYDVGYSSAPAFADLDGDRDFDLVIVAESGDDIYYLENTGTATNPAFTQRTGAANPLDGVDVDAYSTATFTDLDGDRDPDLIIGKRDGTIDYYENTGTATGPVFTQRTGDANPLDGIYNEYDSNDGSVDIFVFDVGHGEDYILDFADNEDKIDLSAFNLSGFDDLTLSSASGHVTMDLSGHGGGTILLQNFDMSDLDATDFIF